MPLPVANRVASQLVRFLIDRLDEDDERLRRLARAETKDPSHSGPLDGVRSSNRIRADIIAKRHVIGDLQLLLVLRDLPIEEPVRELAFQGLRALAAPYAEHRTFRDEWRSGPESEFI